jgi:hypothetical protein
MARQPSDAEIWEAVQRCRPPSSDFPDGSRMPEALAIVAVSDLMGITPERVRNVIAMRATPIGF